MTAFETVAKFIYGEFYRQVQFCSNMESSEHSAHVFFANLSADRTRRFLHARSSYRNDCDLITRWEVEHSDSGIYYTAWCDKPDDVDTVIGQLGHLQVRCF